MTWAILPFGHARELFPQYLLQQTGRWFFHNVQSVRVRDGLRNLSLGNGGVICHNGEFEQQILQMSDLSIRWVDKVVERLLGERSRKAVHACVYDAWRCVMRISDVLRMLEKDRQDALRASACFQKRGCLTTVLVVPNAWILLLCCRHCSRIALVSPQDFSQKAFKEMKQAARVPEDLWCIRSQWEWFLWRH